MIVLALLLSACNKGNSQPLINDLKELSSDKYEGRKTATEGSRKAAAYIIKRFETTGLTPFNNSWKQSFPLAEKSKKGVNLVGYIAGKSDRTIVISAHYDHLGKLNGKIYNGADDNASGVAGLLAMAAYFKKNPPMHRLVFVCFDAEEIQLQGSKAFVASNPAILGKTILNINLDMISRADKGEIYACGTYHFPEFKPYLKGGSKQVKLLLGHDDPKLGNNDWTSQSDHVSFHNKGIPFIYFGVEDHKDYHKSSDDFSAINTSVFQDIVSTITKITAEMDKGVNLQKSFRDKLIMKERNTN